MNRRELLKGTAAASVLAGLTLPAKSESLVLDFPTWQADTPGFGAFYRSAISAFEAANPGVTIRMQQIAFADYVNQLTIRFASGRPPHILVIPSDSFGVFASQGWLKTLDDGFAGGALKTNWSTLQSELDWDGQTQGMLMMGYGLMLFYNQALLDAAGVEVPTSFDAFRAAVAKVTNRDAGIFGLASVTSEHPTVALDFIQYIRWQGQDLVKDGAYNLTDSAVVEAIRNYRETVGKNAPLGNNSTLARDLFTDGRAAFLVDGPWMYTRMDASAPEIRPNLHMIKAPFSPVLGGASNSVHIPAGLDPAIEGHVADFLTMLAQPEWQEEFARVTASPSGRQGVLSAQTVSTAPHLATIAEAAVGAEPIIPNVVQIRANSSEFSAIIRRAALGVLSTEEPVEDILARAQQELDAAIPLAG